MADTGQDWQAVSATIVAVWDASSIGAAHHAKGLGRAWLRPLVFGPYPLTVGLASFSLYRTFQAWHEWNRSDEELATAIRSLRTAAPSELKNLEQRHRLSPKKMPYNIGVRLCAKIDSDMRQL